jgi:hypothetical protein
MSYLKRIGPGSAFKVGALVYAIVGLIAGVFCSVIAFAAPCAPPGYTNSESALTASGKATPWPARLSPSIFGKSWAASTVATAKAITGSQDATLAPNITMIYNIPPVFVVRTLSAISSLAMASSKSGCLSSCCLSPLRMRCASATCSTASWS